MEYHNVILFGAGASHDAGIPLLRNFVDCMWEFAMRGKVENVPIPEYQLKTLVEANKIRKELGFYQSRAYFNDRNLEDILSLLSFELFEKDSDWKQKYETLVDAISDTIELSCNLKFEKHSPELPYIQNKNQIQNIYHQFWAALFSEKLSGNLPAIITFNYDLVFERSLWQFFHQRQDNDGLTTCPDSVTLGYFYDKIKPFRIKANAHHYNPNGKTINGIKAEFDFHPHNNLDFSIPYLKLHGSLNWEASSSVEPASELGNILLRAVPKPFILPPVFNKISQVQINQVWSKALNVLRNAKHIVVVGYSLPSTDVYMQYFLKSSVGPNSDLSKITVFDPVLFLDNEDSSALRRRYSECFSPQFQSRIDFRPSTIAIDHFFKNNPPKNSREGTFFHFVRLLANKPEQIFFMP